MKHLGKLIAVAAVALTLMTTSAQAHPGIASHMKATVTFGDPGSGCAYFDAPLSADPPNYLTIYLNLAPYQTCEGSINDPNVTFNDPSASAVVDRLWGTVNRNGVSCTYQATNISLTGDVSTRDYSGTFTSYRVDGSIFFCPSSTQRSMTVDFH